MTINWKQKISSRKLWIGVALVVIGCVLCIAGEVEAGMTLIAMGGIGYLSAEALVDILRNVFTNNQDSESEDATVSTEFETGTTIFAADTYTISEEEVDEE